MNQAYNHLIGTRIRSVRMQEKLSQEHLAAKAQLLGCDLTRSALAKLNAGSEASTRTNARHCIWR